MHTQTSKSKERKNKTADNFATQNKSNTKQECSFVDNRSTTIAQRKLHERLANDSQKSVQLKTMIARLDINNPRHCTVMKFIARIKRERITPKNAAREIWINHDDPMPFAPTQGEVDDSFNEKMINIRAIHEQKMQALAANALETGMITADQIKTGDDYYGDVVPGGLGAREVRQRPDGKSYVRDDRGTFTPRVVRREITGTLGADAGTSTGDIADVVYRNQLLTRGLRTHAKHHPVRGAEPVDGTPLASTPMTPEDREFAQQSKGGGRNTYAISHTATTGPILSNAHDGFGSTSAGNLITDVSETQGLLRAQWSIGPGGWKVPLNPTAVADQTARGTGPRGAVVTKSGYRNMEVLTGNIAGTDMRALHLGVEGAAPGGHPYLSGGGEELRADRLNPALVPGAIRRDANGPR